MSSFYYGCVSFIWALTLLNGSVSSETMQNDSSLPKISVNTSESECGGFMKCPTGGIFHKPLERLQISERCVWTVQVPNNTKYTVKIDYLGFEANAQLLTIASFGLNEGNIPAYYFPSSAGEVIEIDGSTLVITFQFDNTQSNQNVSGFALHYNNLDKAASNSSIRCGEVTRCATGSIIYKPFETVLENERCAWTIATPLATSYKINVQHLGFEPSDQLLTISGFRKGGFAASYDVQIPASTGEIYMLNVNTLVITYHSNFLPAKGFALQYTGLEESFDGSYVEPLSRYELVGSETLYLKHPPSENDTSVYMNTEFSTFVFPPVNNIFQENKEMDIVYKRIGLEIGVCEDNLTFRRFNSTSNRWPLITWFCWNDDTGLIKGNDIILAMFSSNDYRTAGGFRLTFST